MHKDSWCEIPSLGTHIHCTTAMLFGHRTGSAAMNFLPTPHLDAATPARLHIKHQWLHSQFFP